MTNTEGKEVKLSDFKGKKNVVLAFYVHLHRRLNEGNEGVSARATIVIDKEGIIRHVEEGLTAIDPTGAYQACRIFDKKKS